MQKEILSKTEEILEALRFLSARCDGAAERDGVGFSKPDSYKGKRLAVQEWLTEEEAELALAMLDKYRDGQLKEAGLSLPDKEQALQEARRVEDSLGQIAIKDDLLLVTFPYSPRLVAKVKAVKKARWNGVAWTVPVAFGKELLAAVPTFALTDDARQAIEAYVPPAVVYAGKLTLDKETVIAAFEYDPDLVTKVKAIKGARFNGTDKTWRIPVEQARTAVETLLNFEVDPALRDRIKADEAAVKAQAKKEAKVSKKLRQTDLDQPLPSGRKLFKHQQEGVRWLLDKKRAILADEMGLGKSLQALVAAKAFDLPIIVVAPASLLINWQREAEMAGAEIQTYSWAKVPPPPDHDFVLIADEAHYALSLKTVRTKALLALTKSAHCQGVFLASGTPIKNGRPTNLYPLLVAIKHPIAEDRREYERRYCNAHETRWTRWDVSGASNLDELHQKTKDAILRRLKKDCLDLPEKTRVIRAVEVSEKARKVYEETFARLRAEYRKKFLGDSADDESLSGPAEALVMINYARHATSLAKVDTAVELAQDVIEEGGQVVLFVAFLESGRQITEALGCRMLSGSETGPDRQQMVDDFQAGKQKALVCTFGAGGVGITLTAAQTVILVDRPWTPGETAQAEDRLHRIGQKNAVTAFWLQHGGVDIGIDHMLQAKEDRIELVLAGKRKTLRGTSNPAEFAAQLLPLIMEE